MKRSRKLLIASALLTLLAGMFAMLVYESSLITRQYFSAPDASFQSWEEILSSPQFITIRSYSTGSMHTPLSKIMNLEHENAVDIEERMLDLPVIACIMHHKNFGHYLIDAGLDASYVNNPYGTVKGMIVEKMQSSGSQEPNTHISAILERQNIQLQGVWLTHLHPDHVAGVVDLPKDIPYVVGENERYLNFRFFLKGDHLAGVNPLYEIDFAKGVDLPPFGKCVDLLGDGSFWAIESRGHSSGHVMYFINGVKEKVLVTGDACNFQYQFDVGVGSGDYSIDLEKGQEIMEAIIEFKKRYPEIKLVYGHEL